MHYVIGRSCGDPGKKSLDSRVGGTAASYLRIRRRFGGMYSTVDRSKRRHSSLNQDEVPTAHARGV